MMTACWYLATLVVATDRAAAQPVPLGDEIAVNTFTSGEQRDPAVARDGAGNFVVVWQSDRELPIPDVSIRGQRYASDGSRVGTEFLVDASPAHASPQPDVAMANDGSFVVVWKDQDETSAPNIAGRAFDRSAVALDERFEFGSPQYGGSFGYDVRGDPAVAANSNGEFLVVWSAGDQLLEYFGYVSYLTIRAQRIDSGGRPAGTEFHAGGSGRYWTISPDVAAAPSGEFVVVWSESGYEYGYEYGYYTRTRSFAALGRSIDATGPSLSSQFFAGTDAYGTAVSTTRDGGFVVTWPTYHWSDRGKAVMARRFDVARAALGEPFLVSAPPRADGPGNGRTNAGRSGYDVAVTADGHFVAVWAEGGSSYQGSNDGSSTGVFARSYAPDGTPIGTEVQVNQYTLSGQSRPAIVATSDDALVVAWRSYGQDGSDWSVRARRLRAVPDCGDSTADGETTAADALEALRAVVGLGTCAVCVCDADGSGVVSATDALRILGHVVGQQGTLACGAC